MGTLNKGDKIVLKRIFNELENSKFLSGKSVLELADNNVELAAKICKLLKTHGMITTTEVDQQIYPILIQRSFSFPKNKQLFANIFL